MDITEMHKAFRLELDKSQSLDYPDFLPEEIDFWLNKAIRAFVKTRYSGSNVKRESFEESQKRIDDLRTLIKEHSITPVSAGSPIYPFSTYTNVKIKDNSYIFPLPVLPLYVNSTSYTIRPYWHTLGEQAQIVFGNNSITTGITQSTIDKFERILNDPQGEHVLHYNKAKPIRLFRNNYVEIISDGNYTVSLYFLRYLAKPVRVNSLSTSGITSGNILDDIVYTVVSGSLSYNSVTYTAGQKLIGLTDYSTFSIVTGTPTLTMNSMSCDLPEHTHDEIVTIAVNMVLENIEQQRYQTHTVELNKSE
jgi:hypothetical protein